MPRQRSCLCPSNGFFFSVFLLFRRILFVYLSVLLYLLESSLFVRLRVFVESRSLRFVVFLFFHWRLFRRRFSPVTFRAAKASRKQSDCNGHTLFLSFGFFAHTRCLDIILIIIIFSHFDCKFHLSFRRLVNHSPPRRCRVRNGRSLRALPTRTPGTPQARYDMTLPFLASISIILSTRS